MDKVGHYFISLPSKLLLWNWDVANHSISSKTETSLQNYLETNNLKNVKIRLNQYAPGGEWLRLIRNKEVGAGWRYTLGALACAQYTIFPGRFFAGLLSGDEYNPYTNTISLYSDIPVIAYHEGGHAKDLSETKWKGTYSAIRLLPLAPLYQEYVASRDAISYTYYKDNPEEEQAAYKILYPAMGTYVAGEAINIIGWFSPLTIAQEYLIQAGAVIGGHIAGRTQAAIRDEETPAQEERSTNAVQGQGIRIEDGQRP